MATLTESCIAHWKLNENYASQVVIDSAGGNSGLAQQNTEDLHTTGKIDGALTFNGTDDYIAITDPSEIDITEAPLSIFVWVYPSATNPQTGHIIAKNVSSPENVQYGMAWGTTNKDLICYLEGAVRASSGEPKGNSMPIGQWSFVGFTWDGTNVSCFVNGGQNGIIGTYTGSLTSRTYCHIGRRMTASYFKGSLDSIMLFNKVLVQDEINFLYNNGIGTENLEEFGIAGANVNENWSF